MSIAEGDAVEETIRTVITSEIRKQAVLLGKKKLGKGMVSTCKKNSVGSAQAERYFV